MKWSREDQMMLIRLKEFEGKTWTQTHKAFAEARGKDGRNKVAIQVCWTRSLNKRDRSKDFETYPELFALIPHPTEFSGDHTHDGDTSTNASLDTPVTAHVENTEIEWRDGLHFEISSSSLSPPPPDDSDDDESLSGMIDDDEPWLRPKRFSSPVSVIDFNQIEAESRAASATGKRKRSSSDRGSPPPSKKRTQDIARAACDLLTDQADFADLMLAAAKELEQRESVLADTPSPSIEVDNGQLFDPINGLIPMEYNIQFVFEKPLDKEVVERDQDDVESHWTVCSECGYDAWEYYKGPNEPENIALPLKHERHKWEKIHGKKVDLPNFVPLSPDPVDRSRPSAPAVDPEIERLIAQYAEERTLKHRLAHSRKLRTARWSNDQLRGCPFVLDDTPPPEPEELIPRDPADMEIFTNPFANSVWTYHGPCPPGLGLMSQPPVGKIIEYSARTDSHRIRQRNSNDPVWTDEIQMEHLCEGCRNMMEFIQAVEAEEQIRKAAAALAEQESEANSDDEHLDAIICMDGSDSIMTDAESEDEIYKIVN